MGKYEIEYIVPIPSDKPWCKYDYQDKAYQLAHNIEKNGYQVEVRCEEIAATNTIGKSVYTSISYILKIKW